MFQFSIWKNKSVKKTQQATSNPTTESDALKKGLTRTRHQWVDRLKSLVLGKKTIEPHLLKEIEACLLTSDVGLEATQAMIADLTHQLERAQLNHPQQVLDELKTYLESLLLPVEKPFIIPDLNKPYVILTLGVNGVGKTTTIGKIASYLQSQGKTVLLAAGDTFRAAAIAQLKTWGEAHSVPVIAQSHGADSASVCFDALQAAQSRNIDVVIIDTAGRLHTQDHLMEELKKIKRVLGKLDEQAPHEILLVLDATIGQNSLRQAQVFQKAIGVTGLVLTKLDGTAKGGVIFSIAKTLELPIRFIGVGEKAKDLKPFNAKAFIDALFNDNQE